MVIQANMPVKAIVEVWEDTRAVFEKYNVPISSNPLEAIFTEKDLNQLLFELNAAVGSSIETCVEGG